MSIYRIRRRRRLLVATLALALAGTALGRPGRLLSRSAPTPNAHHTSEPGRDQTGGAEVSWPRQGDAALVLGDGPATASPHQQTAPMASLAKVMTAYLTLERYPLSGTHTGFTVTVTAAEAQTERHDVSQGQSGVAVQAGERLTERQLLEALLVPSGNNIA